MEFLKLKQSTMHVINVWGPTSEPPIQKRFKQLLDQNADILALLKEPGFHRVVNPCFSCHGTLDEKELRKGQVKVVPGVYVHDISESAWEYSLDVKCRLLARLFDHPLRYGAHNGHGRRRVYICVNGEWIPVVGLSDRNFILPKSGILS